MIGSEHRKFIQVAKEENVRLADVTKRLPLPDSSTDVVYTSHMVEHLDRNEARAFLIEAQRILTPDGIIRIVVPDIKQHVAEYIETGDADEFIRSIHLAQTRPKGVVQVVKHLLIGNRRHHWMYDASSLINLLASLNFREPREQPPGSTIISEPGALNLRERETRKSLYVEAYNAASR